VRAVIDNNVLVSGLLWGDKPGRVLTAVAEGRIQIFLSEELLAELREVLRRRKFAARLALKELTPETPFQTGRGCSSKSVNREHTGSNFLLPFTLYRWTESVTCAGSSLFAVGYAYSERHRKYSARLPFRLRQTNLNPRQECQ